MLIAVVYCLFSYLFLFIMNYINPLTLNFPYRTKLNCERIVMYHFCHLGTYHQGITSCEEWDHGSKLPSNKNA